MLEKFTSIQQENLGEQSRFMKNKGNAMGFGDETKTDGEVKFVKTKEKQKLLLVHLIGISIMLSNQSRLRASVLSHMLKKDTSELKQYLRELGVRIETMVAKGKDDSADLMLFFSGRDGRKAAKEKAAEAEDSLSGEAEAKVGTKRDRANTE